MSEQDPLGRDGVSGPSEARRQEELAAAERPSMINVRNISIKCGNCNTYQTLSAFTPGEDRHIYTYECENDTCDPAVTRTLIEVPVELDEFARRDPGWRGGGRHGERGDA